MSLAQNRRFRIIVHVLAGVLLTFVAVAVDYVPGGQPGWGRWQTVISCIGLAIGSLGFAPTSARVASITTNASLSILSFCAVLAICEGFFRVLDVDLTHQEEAWRRVPPFFRQPIVPSGEVFFRHSGPETWRGQVLNTQLKLQRVRPNPYGDESAVTISYNATGFRNADEVVDWEIAVAGDSFTELGHLPDDEVFTRMMSQLLNLRVLNLGTSYTGPLTQLSYLKDYGISRSTRHAVIVFFEGNDLNDLDREYGALLRWRETGEREYRHFATQSSFVRALDDLVIFAVRQFSAPPYVEAYFTSSRGDLPVTLTYTPPGRTDISGKMLAQLNYFFDEYAKFGADHKLSLSLAYVPCKTRVLQGLLRFPPAAPGRLRNWNPTDLPELISTLAEMRGIAFIDLTPTLVETTRERMELVYNSIFDSHFNALGSQVVARELAAALAPAKAAAGGLSRLSSAGTFH